jgi:hypothetical protein
MKFKLKMLAAAVALAAAAGTQAAVDNGAGGNGDLFVSLTTGANAAGHGTAAFDLGFTMSDAAIWNGVAGLTLQWNLSTGAFTSNNAGIAASNPTLGTYGSALSTFQGLSGYSLSTTQMSVLAFDATGAGATPGTAGANVLSTANIISNLGAGTQPGTTFGPTNGQFAGTFGNATVGGYLATMNADTGMAAAVGNNTAANGEADHYPNGSGMQAFGGLWSGFDNNGLYGGQYAAGSTTFAGLDKAMPFFQFFASSLTSTARAGRTAFGYDLDGDGTIEFDNNGATAGGSNEFGLWTLQGNVLQYMNPMAAAPIPEPSTYAMIAAGLLMVGGIARRRLS